MQHHVDFRRICICPGFQSPLQNKSSNRTCLVKNILDRKWLNCLGVPESIPE